MLILNDEQFVEGFIGGFAWIISVWYIRRQLKDQNILIVGLCTWAILWYIRKILMNFYKQYKSVNKKNFKGFNINIQNKNILPFILITILVCCIIMYFFLIKGSPINKHLRMVDIEQLDNLKTPNGLVIFMLIMTFLVYIKPLVKIPNLIIPNLKIPNLKI